MNNAAVKDSRRLDGKDYLRRGSFSKQCLTQDPDFQYFLYVPDTAGEHAKTFVTVHGYTRNVIEHVEMFAPFAYQHGLILVAPLFSKERFPDYQRLGRKGKGGRADIRLDMVVSEAAGQTGADSERIYLFGFSGGGQFVHRYAMAYPERVSRAVIASAGWYTFPDPVLEYPFGIRNGSLLSGIDFNPGEFLQVPVCVMVGEHDIERDDEFRKSKSLDRQQGTTRLERGRRWIRTVSAAAKALSLDTVYNFEVLPESNHSFAACMKQGNMGERVFAFLLNQNEH
jgi:pimeloyl-ACP methyl ester carboxylesterase